MIKKQNILTAWVKETTNISFNGYNLQWPKPGFTLTGHKGASIFSQGQVFRTKHVILLMNVVEFVISYKNIAQMLSKRRFF